jgi:hypothetical protein
MSHTHARILPKLRMASRARVTFPNTGPGGVPATCSNDQDHRPDKIESQGERRDPSRLSMPFPNTATRWFQSRGDQARARLGGTFHASTIRRGHLAELGALVPGWDLGRHAEGFGLETGPEQLQPFFADIRVERFEGGLAVTDADPVLAYIRSSERYDGEDLTGAGKTVQRAIARYGAFTIAQRVGVISGRKP